MIVRVLRRENPPLHRPGGRARRASQPGLSIGSLSCAVHVDVEVGR